MAATNQEQAQALEAKASLTAYSVIHGFLRALILQPKFTRHFGEDERKLVEHMVQSIKSQRPFTFSFNGILELIAFSLPYRWQSGFFDKAVKAYGYDTLIATRKAMIKSKIDTAAQFDTPLQVLFLGSGYDVRALAVAITYPKAMVFELDRGLTRRQKLNVFFDMPESIVEVLTISKKNNKRVVINDNLISIDCDFREDKLEDVLADNGFNIDMKTIVVAEGLTMYLSKAEVKELLQALKNILKNPESEVIMSFLPRAIGSKVQEKALDDAGESHQFILPFDEVVPFVNDEGFKVYEKCTVDSAKSFTDDPKFLVAYPNYESSAEPYYMMRLKDDDADIESLASMNDIPECKM